MSTPPSSRKAQAKVPRKERRSPRGAPGSLRWIKSLLNRPVGLQRRGAQWHVVLLDRRSAATADEPLTLTRLRAELRTRLLANESDHADQSMRELVAVHDELGRRGWRGVEVMPRDVLGMALMQAKQLATEEASPALATLTERLHLMQVAADLRDERLARQRAIERGEQVEVTEVSQEDFQETERSWIGTISPELPPPAEGH